MVIESLLIALILTLFGFDELFIKAFDELFNMKITNATYYFVFFVIGVLFSILEIIFKKEKEKDDKDEEDEEDIDNEDDKRVNNGSRIKLDKN